MGNKKLRELRKFLNNLSDSEKQRFKLFVFMFKNGVTISNKVKTYGK